jgi:mediator of RNA polymerase II transcription subunit 5
MTSLQTWQHFLARSLATRLEPSDFESYVQLLCTKHPLPASRISDLFLQPTEYNDASLDPRVVRYVQVLVHLGLVTVPSVLRAMWKCSSFRDQDGGGTSSRLVHNNSGGGNGEVEKLGKREEGKRWSNSYIAEETLFYRLTKYISSGAAPRDTQEAVELVLACVQWMRTVVSVQHAAVQQMLGLAQTHTAEMNAQNMALGTLIVAAVESGRVLHALGKGNVPKHVRKELKDTLASFVPLLLQSSPQSAARLEVFRTQTMLAIEPVDKKEKAAEKEIEDILEEGMALGVESMVVAEMPIMNSRAGLYVYLNSLVSSPNNADEYFLTSLQLVGRPLIDDHAIFAYLNNRYQVIPLSMSVGTLLTGKGDIQSTIIDLILAAFDILANATFRNERTKSITILRSFLCNKIPPLLATLSESLFPPLTSEYCITEALNHVDTNAFPTLSGMFDESSTNNMFSDSVRQDFCFACCLHGLIEESSIEGLLGDIPMQSLPAGGRYLKDDLVQQCLSDPARTERLIHELELMDGNVGAVSQAITEARTLESAQN